MLLTRANASPDLLGAVLQRYQGQGSRSRPAAGLTSGKRHPSCSNVTWPGLVIASYSAPTADNLITSCVAAEPTGDAGRLPGLSQSRASRRSAPIQAATLVLEATTGPREQCAAWRSGGRGQRADSAARTTPPCRSDARICVLTEQRPEFPQFRGPASVFGFTVAGHGRTGGAGY